MQTLLRRLAAFGIALAALFSLFPCQAHAVSTSASSAILMDVDSGRVLYEQNADAKMLIAVGAQLALPAIGWLRRYLKRKQRQQPPRPDTTDSKAAGPHAA